MKPLTKYIAASLIIGSGLFICDKIKESDLVQKVASYEHKKLEDRSLKKIMPLVKGTKKIYVKPGTGFYDLINVELGKKDSKLSKLKKQYHLRNDELTRVYRVINNGELRFPESNTIPNW